MAESGDLRTFTLNAAADLSGKRYHLMRQSAEGSCNMASLSTNSALVGVLQSKPESGENASIAYLGKSKVVAGGAVTAGVMITNNSSGRAAAVASGGMACGRALQAAGADGEVISVLLFPPVRWNGAP